MYFDYLTENNLFDVMINNGLFINNNCIQSIDISENEIIIIFHGVTYKKDVIFPREDCFIVPKEIEDYFTNERHTIVLRELNRQGITIKNFTYYHCQCKSIINLGNNNYKLVLLKATKDDDLPIEYQC